MQNRPFARGYFVTKTNAGAISLENEPDGIAPYIFQQPAAQKFKNDATVHFSIGAAGSEPLGYQWETGGNYLTNGGNISGATSNLLTIANEVLTDSIGYSVIVSNAYGMVTSSVAKLTIPAPTLSIKPLPASVTNAALTVKGAAAGKYGVTNVFYQVLYQTNSGTNWILATTNEWTNAPSSTNWSVNVTLQAGSNIFEAYSVDPLGNPSLTSSEKVFYATYSHLTLMTNGPGTTSPKVPAPICWWAAPTRSRPPPPKAISSPTGPAR